MGMRAVFAYRNEEGITTVTTIQWSTLIEKNLQKIIELAPKNNLEAKDIIKNLAETVSQHEHITCVDIDYQSVLDSDNAYRSSNEVNDTVIQLEDDEKEEPVIVNVTYLNFFKNAGQQVQGSNLLKIIDNHPHAQDGVSWSYDALKDPNHVTIVHPDKRINILKLV